MRCRLTVGWIGLFASLFAASAATAGTPPHEAAYQQARRAYYAFKADEHKQKFRHNWQNVARKFERVFEEYPDSPRAPDALYTAGKLCHDLYVISRVGEDLDKATGLFQTLVERFPSNHLADDAQMYIVLKWVEFEKDSARARKALAFLVERFPEGDVTPKARRMLEDLGGPPADDDGAKSASAPPKEQHAPPPQPPQPEATPSREASAVAAPGPAVLESIRHWSNPGYTRISLYTRAKTRYRTGKLEADPERSKPARLYVDLMDTGLEGDLSGPVEVRDSVVRRIRFAERKQGFVRVVVELDGDLPHRVFPLDDPSRVVLDIMADEDQVASVIGEKLSPRPGHKKKKIPKKKIREMKNKSQPGASLSMLAGLKIKRVVLDPGHGGKDPGAIGASGLLEKDVVLDVARRLRSLLEDELGLEVLLTRNRDRFLALEARTAFANKRNADLFVSIHMNAHRNRRFRGVECFYLDLTNDRYSIKLAARENATSEKSISDLRYILADLALKSHVDDSISLSRMVQKGMVGTLRRHYKNVRDLGLKPALFYVLIGARMPSILVEGSFLTNPMEEKRLRSKTYRQKVAEGIYVGIKNFIEERDKLYDPDRL